MDATGRRCGANNTSAVPQTCSQVQAEISRDIARKLQLRLTPGQQQRLATRGVRNPEAV